MRRAWGLARDGAARFGGTVRAYFAEALRLTWAEVKARLAVARGMAEERFALTVTGLLVLREAQAASPGTRHEDQLELALEVAHAWPAPPHRRAPRRRHHGRRRPSRHRRPAGDDPHPAWHAEWRELREWADTPDTGGRDLVAFPQWTRLTLLEERIAQTPARTLAGACVQVALVHYLLDELGSSCDDDVTALVNALATLERLAGEGAA
jgi:protein Gp111